MASAVGNSGGESREGVAAFMARALIVKYPVGRRLCHVGNK